MTNYNQLNEEQRETIQVFFNKDKTFTFIGEAIHSNRTTVSREIRRNRYIKSNYYEPFDKNECSTISKESDILSHFYKWGMLLWFYVKIMLSHKSRALNLLV